jgi:CubicO group peptidase (beta-lactamase class C family)
MQMVEQNKLDLSKSANDYLPDSVQLPDSDITLKMLMTHVSGLEEQVSPVLFFSAALSASHRLS